jgi:hypothetical protein
MEENIMQSQHPSRAWLISLALTLTLGTVAYATSGRDFSGYFDVSHVQEQGDLVQVTLHLKLFNHGESDARSVIVALLDSSPAMTVRGNFQPVKVWKSGQFIELRQEFSVTKREFNEWMGTPIQPNLLIFFQDAKGKTWQRGVQLSRRPLVRVEEQ